MHPLRLAHACRTTLGAFVFTTVLAFALPTLSSAQTVASNGLVGSWARQGEKEAHFIFQADSTATIVLGSRGAVTGRWRLAGDTLAINDLKDAKGAQLPKFDRRLVKLEEKKLTLTRVDNGEAGPKTAVYERVDSLKVDPPKP